jgi:hypothetical protein
MIRTLSLLAVLVAATLLGHAQQRVPGQVTPPRDSSGRPREPQAAGTGRIGGRVMAADGRAIKRARVLATARELANGQAALTDENGIFDIAELPAGHYTITASKSGFLTLSYGQRRPLQSGVPLDLADGQQLKGIDLRLPRGGVIEGRIQDEDGYPIAGVMVRAMRYQYVQGNRRLMAAASMQTDDEGHYRIWGLMPGDYYVNAVARVNLGGMGGGIGGGRVAEGAGGRGGFDVLALVTASMAQIAGQNVAAILSDGTEKDPVSLAPTYYPGVPSPSEASVVKLGLGEQARDINFQLQLVRTARIDGQVVSADGAAIAGGTIQLTPASDPLATRTQIGDTFGARIQGDGAFSVNNVLPGSYIMRAHSDAASGSPQFATQMISVAGSDLSDLVLVLAPGAALSGTVTFRGAAAPPPPERVVVTAPPTDQTTFPPAGRPDAEGRFTIQNVAAGPHLIRANPNSDKWMLKSVTIEGRDVTDTPIEIRSRESVGDIAIVFTDQVSEIAGLVTNADGAPVSDYTVLAYPTDAGLWRPQARQIMTTRPDQTGKYRLRGLPGGEYYLVTVDPTEQGEWFDPRYLETHRTDAIRVKINDGDVRTQDWRVTVR